MAEALVLRGRLARRVREEAERLVSVWRSTLSSS